MTDPFQIRQRADQAVVRRGLQAALWLALGLAYLMSASGVGPWGSCPARTADGTGSECHDQRGPVTSIQPLVTLGNDTKSSSLWAFILPGAKSHTQNSTPRAARRQVPERAHQLARVSGPPLYRLAPKNSDPLDLPA